MDIWLNLIPSDTYPLNAGLTLSTFTLGRSFPTSDTETWTPTTTINNGASPGACAITYNEVNVGFDERTYGPEKFGLKGPVLCADEFIFDHNAEAFLEGYLRSLEKRSTWSISNRLMNLYSFFVPKHVTVSATNFQAVAGGTGAVPTAGPTLTASRADCELGQDHLDRIAAILNQEGAMMPDSDGWIQMGEAGPEYPLYIGQEMSNLIALNNAEFRQDVRWATPNLLMKRMGASRVIKNFRHVINLYPPRYNYTGTAYTRVNTFRMVPGTKGFTGETHPEWEAADYEAAFVLSPWVLTSRKVPPTNNIAGLNFNHRNYYGEWAWVTGGREITEAGDCFDPLKKLGRHFAEYHHAPKPVYPVFGRMLIYRRCAARDYSCNTCFENIT